MELESVIQAELFPVGVFCTNRKGQCVSVNPRWCELSGLSEEASLGLGWATAIHPEDRERVAREQMEHMARGEHLRIEFRLLRPDQSICWVLSQAVPAFDATGKLTGFVGTVTDITDRVTAEAALRESEERFRGLIELAPDLVTIHRDGVMLYINAAGLRMMRAETPDQMVGRHILEFVLPEHQGLAIERMKEVAKGNAIPLAEMEARRFDGEVIWIETTATGTIYQGTPAVQLVARDVTGRRRTEEAYQAIVEGIREAMWIMDRGADGQWRASFVNRTYVEQARIPSETAVVGKTMSEVVAAGLMDAEAAARSVARYDQCALSDGPLEFENRLRWNGMDAFITTTMTPVRDDLGRCYRIICWSKDLSQRRAHERALAESEANYRAVVEGTSDAIWVMDKGEDGQYRCRLANSKTEKLLGLKAEDMVGRTLHEFLTGAAADRAEQRYLAAEASGGPIEYESIVERAGGREEMVTHLTPLFDANGQCYRIIGSARDVSDRRRAESALLQAQKLESMGVLAGGIAHDFNNLLTTILGNLYLLENELPEESPLRSYTTDSKVAGERGADLVRRLLAFSRPGIQARERIPLERLIKETAGLVQRTLGPSISLVIEPSEAGAIVEGEFSALQQVLLNLLLNGKDAMPAGGEIAVTCKSHVLGNEALWAQRGLLPGNYYEITVQDSGTGMSRDLLQRIFDPFFTTKGVGKGTGLGLSTALSIVRAHGGWLDVESTEGAGSTFRMLLPASN